MEALSFAGIDPHTHLAMPVGDVPGHVSCDDYFSGQSAALAGGTTMHIDFALPVAGDLMAGYKEWQRKAERAVMPYSWHMAITKFDDQVQCISGRSLMGPRRHSQSWPTHSVIDEARLRVGAAVGS